MYIDLDHVADLNLFLDFLEIYVFARQCYGEERGHPSLVHSPKGSDRQELGASCRSLCDAGAQGFTPSSAALPCHQQGAGWEGSSRVLVLEGGRTAVEL